MRAVGNCSIPSPAFYGNEFKPRQHETAIAGAGAILAHLRQTAAEHGIDSNICLHHKALSAAWSSSEGRPLVEVERTDTGEQGADEPWRIPRMNYRVDVKILRHGPLADDNLRFGSSDASPPALAPVMEMSA